MSHVKIKYQGWLLFIFMMACVERIDFELPPAEFQLVVEGMITDTPGPYTVMLSQAQNPNMDSVYRPPVRNATLTLHDDQGSVEAFVEVSPGVYATNGIIKGQVGHSYYIRIQTEGGRIFESIPDKLNPVGEVEAIRFEYEKRTVIETYGEIAADVFNVYVDADAGTADDNYVRWKFTGTYKVETWPELHMIHTPPYSPYKAPFPCSGYILVGGPMGSGGLLVKKEDCTCCTCWVRQYEYAPQLSDTQLISGTAFNNIKVGEVPINSATFHDKYLLEVEQMSLTRTAFEFFKLIRAQKESSSSLFQPPSGEIRGNIKAMNNNDPVVGLFYATSLKKKSRYIQKSDVPYLLTPIDFLTLPCYDFYQNATSTKPDGWDD